MEVLELRPGAGPSGGMRRTVFYSKMPFASKIWFIIKSALYVTIANGIAKSDLLLSDTTLNQPKISVAFVVTAIAVAFGLWCLLGTVEHMMPYPIRRTAGIIIVIFLVASITTAFIEDSNFIRYGLAAYYGIGAVCQLGLLFGRKFVKNFYFVHDLVCGHIIFIPLFILAILQVPHRIQTWLLYQNALSSDVVVSNILRYARKSQESGGTSAPNEDLVEQIAELRKVVQKQEQTIQNLGSSGAIKSKSSSKYNPSTDSIASLITSSRENLGINMSSYGNVRPTGNQSSMPGSVSASNLDVWGEMALGDAAGFSQGGYQTAAARPANAFAGSGDFSFSQPDVMPPR